MTIAAKVIADSVLKGTNARIRTLQLRYPKFIHGEAKTHRLIYIGDHAYELLDEVGFLDDKNLSRNSSSSRAIPVERLIQDVIDDPVIPMHWGKNQPGMQAREECTNLVKAFDDETLKKGYMIEKYVSREKAWLFARDQAIGAARAFAAAGYHKQIINRLIEPFCHINTVVTATEWDNFFELRDHPDAMPEIEALAKAMKKAMAESTPRILKDGEWHLPYVTEDEESGFLVDREFFGGGAGGIPTLIKLSVARCARVSYLTQEGKPPKIDSDLALYDRLVGQTPKHFSPTEHQAKADELLPLVPHLHGNFKGWIQFRKTIE